MDLAACRAAGVQPRGLIGAQLPEPVPDGAQAGGVVDVAVRTEPEASGQQHRIRQQAGQPFGQKTGQDADPAARGDDLTLGADGDAFNVGCTPPGFRVRPTDAPE